MVWIMSIPLIVVASAGKNIVNDVYSSSAGNGCLVCFVTLRNRLLRSDLVGILPDLQLSSRHK